MTRRFRCYVVRLPDGREVRMQARKPPTREVAEAMAELLDAAHRRMNKEVIDSMEKPNPDPEPEQEEKPKE